MTSRIRVGLVGDHNPDVPAHRAIPIALTSAARALDVGVEAVWLPTADIRDDTNLAGFGALWCVPASPYESADGALHAIRFARTQRVPLLGTCGGFQHVLLEYARNAVGLTDATHEELDGSGHDHVVSKLACALLDVAADIHFTPGSRIAIAYGALQAREEYYCSYGPDASAEARVLDGVLRCTARDADGALRAVELADHPFFVATLFQPERAALRGGIPPLAMALIRAAIALRPANTPPRQTTSPSALATR
jgi:CTP synthase (UTP-ammonia lyase)